MFSSKSLTEIIIPNDVTSIVNNAFYQCKSLTEIIFPNDVASINILDNVTSISNNISIEIIKN